MTYMNKELADLSTEVNFYVEKLKESKGTEERLQLLESIMRTREVMAKLLDANRAPRSNDNLLLKLTFELMDVNPVAEHFSTTGGVRTFLQQQADANRLCGACHRITGLSIDIDGFVEGATDAIRAFRHAVLKLRTDQWVTAVFFSTAAVHEQSHIGFTVLDDQPGCADSDRELDEQSDVDVEEGDVSSDFWVQCNTAN